MTGHPEEPPFNRYKSYYLVLKIVLLAVAVLVTLKLIGMI
jgi:hypothetical protein